jgi:hypothetical protein
MSLETATENNNCPICWVDLNEAELKTLQCEHTFHKACIETWITFHESCPYCRTSLKQDRLPISLYDELIGHDGNIEQLTVDNFRYFYYINQTAFNNIQIENFIERIRLAKQIKSNLILCRNYYIEGALLGKPSFGKLIKISQIRYDGYFTCEFNTENGIKYYYSNLHSFRLL